MEDSIKNAKYAAYVPFKKGSEWVIADIYGGEYELAREIIRVLEGMDPNDRPKVPIYHYGKKDGTISYKTSKIFGNGYVYETKTYRELLYKNGKSNRVVWRKRK